MFEIHNPATGEILHEIEEDTAESITAKFETARLAQKIWAQGPLEDRLACVAAFRKGVERSLERLARTLTMEVGKPLRQSRNELKGLIGRLDFFLQNAAEVLADETVFSGDGLVEKISHEPLGVVANISAWNYPYFTGSNVFIPALLAGNAVLYKPSEFACLTGQAIADLLHDSGVPRDVFTVVVGAGAVGSELLRQPVQGVFFTGSYATGSKVAEVASRRMIKFQVELGGKDPVYVCEDVDLNAAAAATADGAFYNNGQSCCSVERLYVHASIYGPFLEAFTREVAGFVLGDPMDENTYLGPLTRPAQLNVLERQVADALSKGARLLCGGKKVARAGNYFEPTVLADVDHGMELMNEETFGPLIGIQKVADDEEALRLMNDTPYGLTAGVYTANQPRATRLLARLNAGSAYWNCCDRVSPRLPWSGRGHSGLGTVLSRQGILTFTQPKAWHLKG